MKAKCIIRDISIEQLDICGVVEEFTEDEAKLIAAVKEAIDDEKSSNPSDNASIISSSSRSSPTETLLPIAERTSTSFASISDIIKGMCTFEFA